MKEEKKEKIFEFLFELWQDAINVWLIVLLWNTGRIWAIVVGLYELLRISARFNLGQKALYEAQNMQTDVITGEFFKKKKK